MPREGYPCIIISAVDGVVVVVVVVAVVELVEIEADADTAAPRSSISGGGGRGVVVKVNEREMMIRARRHPLSVAGIGAVAAPSHRCCDVKEMQGGIIQLRPVAASASALLKKKIQLQPGPD